MKKILFLGYLITPEEANSASGASVAGNKMQWNIIKNLSELYDVEITCVTIFPKASFPMDKTLFVNKENKNLFGNVNSVRVPYCNLPVIKQISQIINVYQAAKSIIYQTGADTLFCFNLFPQIGIPMRWLKRTFKDLNSTCLLADLPIDDNTNRKGFSALLRAKMEKSTWKSMMLCDKYIVLNKYVMEKYLKNKPYIVVDGGIDENDILLCENNKEDNSERNILFCGALNEYNGIMPLLKAMDDLKNLDIYLDIYGSGYLENEVKTAAEKNSKIRYWGRVPNDVVLQKQREAWLLINPRIADDPIAKVTFPSKTFEYMLSGTPVLSTRLNGYGKEYENYMFWLENTDPKTISSKIKQLYQRPLIEMHSFGDEAKKMIISSKTWRIQCKRIAEFLDIGGNCEK